MEALVGPWGVAIAGIIMVGVFLTVRYGGNVRISRDGISASREKEEPEPLIPSKFIKYVLVLSEGSIRHMQTLVKIEKDGVKRSMRIVEEAAAQVSAMFRSGFSAIMMDRTPETARKEKHHYSEMIKGALRESHDMVRSWIIENHFYAMREDEWSAYKKDKTVHVINGLSEYIDSEWFSLVISRDQLRATFEPRRNDFVVVFDSTLDRIRDVSIKVYQAIQEERARYSALVSRLAGYDPYDVSSVD